MRRLILCWMLASWSCFGAAHAYWRINITQNLGGCGGFEVALEEVKFLDSSGNSLTSGGTSSASSCFSGCGGTYGDPKAFDGNLTTVWNANACPTVGSPQWIQYHFASAVDVAAVQLQPWSAAPNDNKAPTAFTIQYSDDGSSFTVAATFASVGWPGVNAQEEMLSFAVATLGTNFYLNWRVMATATNSGNPSMATLALHTTVGGSNIATGITALASKITTGDEAPKAFDGNAATFWLANAAVPQWLAYVFPAAQRIAEFAITARNDSSYTQTPTAFTLQGSNDGTTWTTVASYSGVSWTQGQTQTFLGAPVPGGSYATIF